MQCERAEGDSVAWQATGKSVKPCPSSAVPHSHKPDTLKRCMHLEHMGGDSTQVLSKIHDKVGMDAPVLCRAPPSGVVSRAAERVCVKHNPSYCPHKTEDEL